MTPIGPRPRRVLVLSRSYPNDLLQFLGLWVSRLVHHTAGDCELKVISPVPYCPPAPGPSQYTRFRRVAPRRREGAVEVFHPRFVVGPGRSLYVTEAVMYYLGVRALVDRLRRDFPFDLIHAHFIYPDGVVAARLGQRYGVPVVVTEHAPWRPNWIDRSRVVRRQALWAARRCAFQIAVSQSVRDTVACFTGTPEKVRVIPNGVDGSVFDLPDQPHGRKKNQILYVGVINFNKGLDLLLHAMRRLIREKPDARLVLVGGSFYRHTRSQQERLCRMAQELGLGGHVEFAGMRAPTEVARWMGESALLVLPSRAESFGAVLVEALACGTPVVATRCGGPDDIVTDAVGRLVCVGDETALAHAMEDVLDHPHRYDPVGLRAYALERFSWEQVARRTVELYDRALECGLRGAAAAE